MENIFMGIEKDSPPGVEASRKNRDIAYGDTHRYIGRENFSEYDAEDARKEILKHYNIPPENVVLFPVIPGKKREIRVFTLLKNKLTGEAFYADGHTAHAILLDLIFENYYQKIGIKDRQHLPDDYNDKWKVTKGFIDPYLNGFKNFPSVRSSIIRLMEAKDQNGLSDKQVESMKKDLKNNNIDLPNWIKSV